MMFRPSVLYKGTCMKDMLRSLFWTLDLRDAVYDHAASVFPRCYHCLEIH